MDLAFGGNQSLAIGVDDASIAFKGHSMNSSARFVAQAIDDPARYYRRPSQVIRDRRLDDREKLAILEAWEIEARELAMAEEDGPDGEPTLLQDIMQARGELVA